MKTPEFLKPGLYGAVIGAVALAIVGFSWGGWVTGGAAREMAAEQARMEVVAALVPICIEQSNKDPQLAARMTELENVRSYERRDLVVNAGWATMPGATDANRQVAAACADKLF